MIILANTNTYANSKKLIYYQKIKLGFVKIQLILNISEKGNKYLNRFFVTNYFFDNKNAGWFTGVKYIFIYS